MGRALVPGFPSSLHWLNATPPSAVAMRGWLTVVAFVNIGSTWSIQALHDLQALRVRYPGKLRAFAIHVPRFDHERDGSQPAGRRHRRCDTEVEPRQRRWKSRNLHQPHPLPLPAAHMPRSCGRF